MPKQIQLKFDLFILFQGKKNKVSPIGLKVLGLYHFLKNKTKLKNDAVVCYNDVKPNQNAVHSEAINWKIKEMHQL